MTRVMKLGNGCSLEDIANFVSKLLKSGKVVAIPTDTIYGIAGAVQNSNALRSICNIKGRDIKKPMAICVADVTDIPKWGKVKVPQMLLRELFPGPVTVLLERQPVLNPEFCPDASLVGIRIPNDPFTLHLSRAFGEPFALTSANISGSKSCLAVEEFKELCPHLDIVVDGGRLGAVDPEALGSTIVDLSVEGHYRIQRPGCNLENTLKALHRYHLTEL